MNDLIVEKAIKNATASLAIEGYCIDEQTKVWCRELLNKEITMDEYIFLVKQKVGVEI